jgi:hypothetical protein
MSTYCTSLCTALKKLNLLFAALVCATLLLVTHSTAQQSQANDWTIIPGVRVGPVTANFSEHDLRTAFGDQSVTEGSVPGAEGEPTDATLVYKDDPARSLAIIWKDPDKKVNPDTIMFCTELTKGTCRWHTASGITLGTTLQELEKQNGGPFTFYGFGWDYGGSILSWGGGKFDLKDKAEVGLIISPKDDNWAAKLTAAQRKKVMGETKVSSSNPIAQKLNVVVRQLTVSFPQTK